MGQTLDRVNWRTKDFLFRLLVSYVLIPLVPPVFMLLRAAEVTRIPLGDWFGIVLIYAAFGFGAMLVLERRCYSAFFFLAGLVFFRLWSAAAFALASYLTSSCRPDERWA